MRATDLLTVGEVAQRSGFAPSALRFYERQGLVSATRTSGGQRRYQRSVLRRLAFIRAARNIGLSLDEITAALATLPDGRTPTRADWARLSRSWRSRLDDQIKALTKLRDGLEA
jgi:MerR family redox-sensitive transcriptional activator SoxR